MPFSNTVRLQKPTALTVSLSLECSGVFMFRPQLCIDAETQHPSCRDFFHTQLFVQNYNTVPCDMLVASTISRTLIRRSLKTTSWILSIISGVFTSTGRPERRSSFVDI